MNLSQLAKNLVFLARHTAHQKLTAPRRMRDVQRRSGPFVTRAARGFRFKLYPDQYIDRRIYIDGAYERRFIEFLRARLPRGGLMLDVGANVGNHAIMLSDRFEQVHCFEPNPNVARRLQANIALNGLLHIHVHQVGLGSTEGSLPFREEAVALGQSHFVEGEEAPTCFLPITTGDKWVEEAGLSAVHYIKIDVEGFEPQVLKGFAASLDRFQPLVSFEHHGESQAPAAFHEIVAALPGYRIVEPVLELPGASNLQKARFYLANASNPRLVPVEAPEPRFYPYLLALPPSGPAARPWAA